MAQSTIANRQLVAALTACSLLGLCFEIEVHLPVPIGRDTLALVGSGFVRGWFGPLLKLSPLAALALGVGEDSCVGVGRLDGIARFVNGADLSIGGVGLTGPTDLTFLDRLAGLEGSTDGGGGDVRWYLRHAAVLRVGRYDPSTRGAKVSSISRDSIGDSGEGSSVPPRLPGCLDRWLV
jgi:hypothetical protein